MLMRWFDRDAVKGQEFVKICRGVHMDEFKNGIAEGYRLNTPTWPGVDYTALDGAAHRCNVEFVRILLKKGSEGVSKEEKIRCIEGAWKWAQIGRCIEIMEMFLDEGASNIEPDWKLAVSSPIMTELFLKHECTRKGFDDFDHKNGRTPLMVACENGYTEVVKLLVNHGASVSVQGVSAFTPIHFAAQHGHTDIIEYLLSVGADPLHVDICNMTAVEKAIADKPTQEVYERYLLTQDNDRCQKIMDLLQDMQKTAQVIRKKTIEKEAAAKEKENRRQKRKKQ